MALILEVVDTGTGDVRRRFRLDGQALSIGRDYSNDVILDDPYVDARHARIVRDETGVVVIEDLGSVNRLVVGEETRTNRVPLEAGLELRLGRTTLRFRDPDAPVPPALPDRVETGSGSSRVLARITSREGRIVMPLLATGLTALQTWLGTYGRSSAGEVFGIVVGLAVLALLYVSIWAIATRIIRHRFSFFEHLALASAAWVATMVATLIFAWLSFTFPDGPVLDWAEIAAWWAVLAAAIALHLGFASHLPRKRRWEAGVGISVVLAAITTLSVLAFEEGFSSSIPFSSAIKPVPASLLPTTSVTDFADAALELQEKVDSLAVEP